VQEEHQYQNSAKGHYNRRSGVSILTRSNFSIASLK
jgi:hypothetical protein